MKAIAIKHIGQNATDDTPAFEMAVKGQELFAEEVKEDSWAYRAGYRYSCQDINKRYGSFYVEENEINIVDCMENK